jgi:putative toxin-antitoxin system antitoxin component (TIGR02293 family)
MARTRRPVIDDQVALAARAERGVTADVAKRLADRFGLPLKDFAVQVGLSTRTLARRLADRKPLGAAESSVLLRIERLVSFADDVFESPEPTPAWFLKPLRILGDRAPLAYCATEFGAREVEDTLGRIDHGVFS